LPSSAAESGRAIGTSLKSPEGFGGASSVFEADGELVLPCPPPTPPPDPPPVPALSDWPPDRSSFGAALGAFGVCSPTAPPPFPPPPCPNAPP
jgi:hypothetical protein